MIATPGAARARGAPLVAPGVLIAGIVVFGALLAPAIYGFVAFHGAWWRMAKPAVAAFIVLNVAVNLLVVLGSWNIAGRLDQRLTNILRRTAILPALACMTLLVYSPFAQRSLVLMGAGGEG